MTQEDALFHDEWVIEPNPLLNPKESSARQLLDRKRRQRKKSSKKINYSEDNRRHDYKPQVSRNPAIKGGERREHRNLCDNSNSSRRSVQTCAGERKQKLLLLRRHRRNKMAWTVLHLNKRLDSMKPSVKASHCSTPILRVLAIRLLLLRWPDISLTLQPGREEPAYRFTWLTLLLPEGDLSCQMKRDFFLCDNLEGCEGLGGEREDQEGADICIPMADSCWCMPETNTIL